MPRSITTVIETEPGIQAWSETIAGHRRRAVRARPDAGQPATGKGTAEVAGYRPGSLPAGAVPAVLSRVASAIVERHRGLRAPVGRRSAVEARRLVRDGGWAAYMLSSLGIRKDNGRRNRCGGNPGRDRRGTRRRSRRIPDIPVAGMPKADIHTPGIHTPGSHTQGIHTQGIHMPDIHTPGIHKGRMAAGVATDRYERTGHCRVFERLSEMRLPSGAAVAAQGSATPPGIAHAN
jgi:hypothetical protein